MEKKNDDQKEMRSNAAKPNTDENILLSTASESVILFLCPFLMRERERERYHIRS